MKTGILRYFLLPGIILIAFTGTLMAEDEAGFSASVSVDYFSKFVWRGQNLNDAGVFQFSVEGSAWGFTGEIWSNMPLTDTYGTRSAGEFDEVDYTLDFSRGIPNTNDKIGFSLGVIHYTLAGHEPPTTEIYGGLNFNVPLSPSVKWYRDVDDIDGSYIQFSLGHTFEKIGKLSDHEYIDIDLSASFGVGGSAYNAGYFSVHDPLTGVLLNPDIEKTKFNDFTLGIAVPFHLKHGVRITPSFNMSAMLSGYIRDWYKYGTGKSTNVWFGINFTKEF
jgi:hypothetical protein